MAPGVAGVPALAQETGRDASHPSVWHARRHVLTGATHVDVIGGFSASTIAARGGTREGQAGMARPTRPGASRQRRVGPPRDHRGCGHPRVIYCRAYLEGSRGRHGPRPP
jgi:hypothetical protein